MRFVNIIAKLAWRNLWRNHRRTIVMLSAVTVGVWAMIFMTALMRGMVHDMIRDGIESLPGHVQVHHAEFRNDPSVNRLVPLSDSEIEARLDGAGFRAWASRVNVPAVISSERASRGVTLFGIDPLRERDMTFLANSVVAGRNLESSDDGGVVLGRKLLDTLDTELGKRVVIMSQDPDNEIADRGFRVVGVYETSLEAREASMAFAGKRTVQKMLGIGEGVTEIAVLGDDYRDVEPLVDRVAALVDDVTEVEVLPWQRLDRYIGSMLDVMDGFVLVWIIVIFIALSFGLVNTLVMAVFERVREIGLMLALGLQPAGILLQIVVESLILLAIGLGLGTLLAWLTILPLEDGIDISAVAQGMEMFGAASVLYPELLLRDIVLANVVVLVLGFLASLSPAWRASRYQPVEAITRIA